MPSYDKSPRVTDILKNLSREQRRMAANRRIENTQITQGGITIVDPEGNVVGKIGELDDGTTGIATASGNLDTVIEQTNADVQAAQDAAVAAKAAGDDALAISQAAQSVADDAKTAGENAAAAAAAATAAANTALSTANGKSKSTFSTSSPDATANVAGDLWFQRNASGEIIGQWEGMGGTSWTQRKLRSEVIASLDAGKITSGYIDAARIAAGSIGTRELQADSVTAAKIKAGEVTAGKLAAGAVVAGNVAAGAIVAGDIAANAVTAGTIAAGAFQGSTFTGGTFTGGVFRTADTGARVVVNGPANRLEVYNASGVNTVNLGTLTSGAATGMEVRLGAGMVPLDHTAFGGNMNATSKSMEFQLWEHGPGVQDSWSSWLEPSVAVDPLQTPLDHTGNRVAVYYNGYAYNLALNTNNATNGSMSDAAMSYRIYTRNADGTKGTLVIDASSSVNGIHPPTVTSGSWYGYGGWMSEWRTSDFNAVSLPPGKYIVVPIYRVKDSPLGGDGDGVQSLGTIFWGARSIHIIQG